MAEEKAELNAEVKSGEEEAPYLGTYKTKEEAEEGLINLTSKLGEQGQKIGDLGNTVSSLESQLQATQKQIQDFKAAQARAPVVSETEKALAEVTAELADFDPTDDPLGYSQLQERRYQLGQEVTKEKVLAATREEVQGILTTKDIQTKEEKWLGEHPDFNDPTMQAEIQKLLAKPGIHDAVSAYYEIKGKMTDAQLAEATKKIEEAEKIANLKKGETTTGKVVTGEGTGVQPKTQTKTKPGTEEYEAGLQAAFNAAA